jgi:hypothetical protein
VICGTISFMARGSAATALLLALIATGLSCGSDSVRTCEPGAQRDCFCGDPGSYKCHGTFVWLSYAIGGAETCSADGSSWSRCDCLSPLDQGCVDACASASPSGHRQDLCSGQLARLILELPSGADAAACRAAYLGFVPCTLGDGAGCSAEVDALDAACKPCCTQTAGSPGACGP